MSRAGNEFPHERKKEIVAIKLSDSFTYERLALFAEMCIRDRLEALANVPDDARTGRFVSTLVFVDEDGTETVARGTVEGRIGHEERGSEGFGYDPLFFPDVFGGERTLAEVGRDEKNAVSHRGNALRELKAKLASHR